MTDIVLHSLGRSIILERSIPVKYEIGLAEIVFKNTFINIPENTRIRFKCYNTNSKNKLILIGATSYTLPSTYYNSFQMLKEVLLYKINANRNNPTLRGCQMDLLNRMVAPNNQFIIQPSAVENESKVYVLSMTEALKRLLGLAVSSIKIYSRGYTAPFGITLNQKTVFNLECEQVLRTNIANNTLRTIAVRASYNQIVCIEFDNIEYRELHGGSQRVLNFNFDSDLQILYFTLFLRPQRI